MCQELGPVPSVAYALEQGPGDPVYHHGVPSEEVSTSGAMAQEIVPVPSSAGALEQSRLENVYHQRRKCHHKTVLGSGISFGRVRCTAVEMCTIVLWRFIAKGNRYVGCVALCSVPGPLNFDSKGVDSSAAVNNVASSNNPSTIRRSVGADSSVQKQVK